MLGDPGVGPNRSHWSRGAEIATDSGGRNSGTLAKHEVSRGREPPIGCDMGVAYLRARYG